MKVIPRFGNLLEKNVTPPVNRVADATAGAARPRAIFRSFFSKEIPKPGITSSSRGSLFDFLVRSIRAFIPRQTFFATVAKLQEVRAPRRPDHVRWEATTIAWGGSFFTADLGIEFFGGEAELDLAGPARAFHRARRRAPHRASTGVEPA